MSRRQCRDFLETQTACNITALIDELGLRMPNYLTSCRCAFVAIAFATAHASPSSAQANVIYFKTSDSLLADCKAHNQFLQGACSGYIVGTIDTLEVQRFALHEPSCLVKGETVAELKETLLNAMQTNIAYSGNLPASIVIQKIYRHACGKL